MNTLLETATEDKEQQQQQEDDEEKAKNQLGPKTRETELRLGFSVNGSGQAMGVETKGGKRLSTTHEELTTLVVKQRNGAKRWLSETQDGPWILGPKQENTAVFPLSNPSPLSRAPPVVGWPPVCAFRRNLALPPKPEMESKPAATPLAAEAIKKSQDSMYVKVNLEGYAVGRKINLKAHDGYESLSHALQKMFDNFFLVNYSKNQEVVDDEEKEENEVESPKHVLVYEDNEGDRMLVGDVPWEMFISTVKRLYIISGSRAPSIVAGSGENSTAN